jgi:hypothetical protein
MSRAHLVWIPIGAAVGFLASFLFGDLLSLPADLYYLIYFTLIGAFFWLYARTTDLRASEFTARRIWWGVALGVIVGTLMVQNVLSRPETARFSGTFLAWAVFWRGIVYGAVDGLLLFAFPWLVAWRALGGEGRPMAGKVAAGVVAWLGILLITTTYHLGYGDFRSRKLLQPNIGSTIGSIPTLVTANPVASPITHVFVHVAAVLHSPHTDLFLPPHRE